MILILFSGLIFAQPHNKSSWDDLADEVDAERDNGQRFTAGNQTSAEQQPPLQVVTVAAPVVPTNTVPAAVTGLNVLFALVFGCKPGVRPRGSK